jgi:ABC-type multidrug transport system permease subunit
MASGKILNPTATDGCRYCRFSTGDQYLATLNMRWQDRWRNCGFLVAYILFNVSIAFTFYYLAKVRGLHASHIARESPPQSDHDERPKDPEKKEG